MSNKNDSKKPSVTEAVGSSVCRCPACKHTVAKFGFCQDHYEMYMAGVIRGDGTKPVDFEKKLERFIAARKAA